MSELLDALNATIARVRALELRVDALENPSVAPAEPEPPEVLDALDPALVSVTSTSSFTYPPETKEPEGA